DPRRLPRQADGAVPRCLRRRLGARGGGQDCSRADRDRGRDRRRSRRRGPRRSRLTAQMPLRALASVNLAAIERNIARLREELDPACLFCAVVKANAYGHGAVPVAHAALAAGSRWLAVATAEEAAELRRGGIIARILVLGALSP